MLLMFKNGKAPAITALERLSQEEHVFQVMRGRIRKKCKEEERGKWENGKVNMAGTQCVE